MACILLVDDDDDIRTTVAAVLASEGHDVVEARNGMHALQELARDPLPEVIILDILMPVMNGFEFLDRMQHDPRIAGIPVLAVTAHAKVGEIRGVVRVIRKPFDLDRLLESIRIASEPAPQPLTGAA